MNQQTKPSPGGAAVLECNQIKTMNKTGTSEGGPEDLVLVFC